ncbi:hypothetical protein MNBD_PLANCTO02-2288 [hydrothermal vent metagenome]|uniref:ABC3 transporter permease C-terminal domain-containing protein n=1 Tax=hydrothermal vent metagenome TaxID=652676 RepID=A0A3B1E307_9ZZZZ
MSILYLIFQEIWHRKLNFVLLFLSVVVTVGSLSGALTLLQAERFFLQAENARFELEESRLQKKKALIPLEEAKVAKAGKEHNDAIRKITKGLGFNIFILPQGQDINELYTEGTLSKTMVEENVTKLANTDIITINHLLPIIIKKIKWKDHNQTIFVVGTRGEIPLKQRASKKPLQAQIPKGEMMIGSLVASKQKLKVGDKVTLKKKSFVIVKINPERGNKEDSTVYIHLAEAQEIFGMQNLIHAIQALECNCATVDRIGEIRKDLEARLPGTQVIENTSTALARAEAREATKKAAQVSLKRARQSVEKNKKTFLEFEQSIKKTKKSVNQFQKYSSVLVIFILASTLVFIGFFTWNNAEQRADEIGILRAIGIRSTQIMILFLGKAILFGFLGAIAGYNIGYAIAIVFNPLPKESPSLFSWQTLLIALVAAPLLSMLGSWLPAFLASQQDPAVVLQDA